MLIRRGYRVFLLVPLMCLTGRMAAGGWPVDTSQQAIEITLNGLNLTVDARTGGLLRMAYAGMAFVDAPPEQAGLVDVAYPLEKFEPLRLAARYSTGARVERQPDGLTITWDGLGASRPFPFPGRVAATVRIQAAPDGRSVILSCEIENHSERPVRQVLFPDFREMTPFAGETDTEFRTAGFAGRPFVDLRLSELDQFYAVNNGTVEYRAGGLFHPMVARWMDVGGLKGGFSLFPRRWGWDSQVPVVLQLSETTGRLRLACAHDVEIKPGETWKSGAFWLTPHTHGWAKGIEPFREWVRQNLKRPYPLPDHIRNGLGYRSVWMCQNQPDDPQDAVWTFRDLPALAKEAKEHGLDEMVLWSWNRGFVLPMPPPYPHLGTEREMAEAVRACRDLGINVSPFISVLQANRDTAGRYGLRVESNAGGWTYHTELVPRFQAPYAQNFSCVQVGPANPKWQEDVLESCKRLVDMGVPSISWDQYWSAPEQPDMNTLAGKIRDYAKRRDPQSAFSGEELWNIEIDAVMLDYTWNWGNYKDYRPLVSVFPAPRVNVNINTSVEAVKLCFADNLYMNVWPKKPGSINGSDLIANHPALSRALKQCAKLRAQFLPYFTGGTLIGECILAEKCRTSPHVSAYILPDRALVVFINRGKEQATAFEFDVESWVKSPSGRYVVRAYDEEGQPVSTKRIQGGIYAARTRKLKPLEMALYEFIAE
jgi:hypothetical protein